MSIENPSVELNEMLRDDLQPVSTPEQSSFSYSLSRGYLFRRVPGWDGRWEIEQIRNSGHSGTLTLEDLFIRAKKCFSSEARPTLPLLVQLGIICCSRICWQIDLTWRKLRSVPASGHVFPVQTEQRTRPFPHTRQQRSKTTLHVQGFTRVSATVSSQKIHKNEAMSINFCIHLCISCSTKWDFSLLAQFLAPVELHRSM